jgi:hypothetical protein
LIRFIFCQWCLFIIILPTPHKAPYPVPEPSA